jgi:hypothetical protein
MIGRADIEESKSNVAMNAWLPQASYRKSSVKQAFKKINDSEFKIIIIK